MLIKKTSLVAVICGLVMAAAAIAAPIPPASYTMSLEGPWVWGWTDWNAVSCFGQMDNNADRARAEMLMSDGYVDNFNTSCDLPVDTTNGLYNWEDVVEADPDAANQPGQPEAASNACMVFDMNGGVEATVDSIDFISSRSYGDSTEVTVEYAMDGGPWTEALSTTSGDLGITTGPGNTYTLNLGGVTGDAFRLCALGAAGDQISFHEVTFDGVAGVPSMPPLGMLALIAVLLTLGFMVLRRRARA